MWSTEGRADRKVSSTHDAVDGPPPFSGSAPPPTQDWAIYDPVANSQPSIPVQPSAGQQAPPQGDGSSGSSQAARNLSPRQRRLAAEADELLNRFTGHRYISVQPVGAHPPERYQVIYALPGLVTDQFNNLQVTNQHLVHISLPGGYPREKPYCSCDSAVFHPNFGSYICIADFWSPSQSVLDVIIQIGDMLQYKLYNVRSPLNAVAARWVQQNLDRVPISDVNLQPEVAEVRLGQAEGTNW